MANMYQFSNKCKTVLSGLGDAYVINGFSEMLGLNLMKPHTMIAQHYNVGLWP